MSAIDWLNLVQALVFAIGMSCSACRNSGFAQPSAWNLWRFVLPLAELNRAAPLSMLTPSGHVQIAFATLIGWQVFSHRPNGWSAAGMVSIALAGIATV